MSKCKIRQLELCHREMFGDFVVVCSTPTTRRDVTESLQNQTIIPDTVFAKNPFAMEMRRTLSDSGVMPESRLIESEKRRASALMDELLVDIYNSMHNGTTDYNSTSGKSQRSVWVEIVDLHQKDAVELLTIINCLQTHIGRMGSALVRQLKRRDALRRQQEAHCDVITRQLTTRAADDSDMRFRIQPVPGESGFSQWAAAMKMVAQLAGGIPPEFRKRLWLTLAEKHLASRGVNWQEVERNCFSEWSHPADAELGVQIVKDLHRTGCSLFCGEDGQENQALLKRVLVAYARWNKAVGYCQGFNMLAALILQVTDKCESDALKLMIYLIEGVLPDSYFADSLRGLSVDMAVFRELLRSKLPKLSKHLDTLQTAAKDGSRSYEPPLTNVFTMQWFLTLFCNCLPQPTVLRVWDLILLEGNEILLRTALGIWQTLEERILSVRSADEFYCIMGVLTREILEFGLVDANSLIRAVVTIGPLTELKSLREHYLYNINPWGPSIPQAVIDKQLKLYPKHNIALDISALKKQYTKLKQRQRQAHIIFSAAISRQPPPATPVAMNHLLLGKSALVPSKRIGPTKGTIPPARQVPPKTLHWKDAPKQTSSSSSSDTELCDEDGDKDSSNDEEEITKDNDKKNGQFEYDNPDADLMNSKNDNTPEVSRVCNASEPTLVTSCSKISSTDDNFSDTFDTTVKITADSDDENFDFEQFLAERLKCLTQPRSISEESEGSRLSYSRRNSERAVQIIQENSLILQRILQCQSRLSPSPPLILNNAPEAIQDDANNSLLSPSFCSGDYSLDENFKASEYESLCAANEALNKMDNVNCWINSQSEAAASESVTSQIKEVKSEIVSPEYGSKYTGLLEKSKSLDQRYNTLILNVEVPTTQTANLEEQRSEHQCYIDDKSYTGEVEACDVKDKVLLGKVDENDENCSVTKTLRNSDKIINENLFLLGNIKNEKVIVHELENVTDDFKISCENNRNILNDKLENKADNLLEVEYRNDDIKYSNNTTLKQIFDEQKSSIEYSDTTLKLAYKESDSSDFINFDVRMPVENVEYNGDMKQSIKQNLEASKSQKDNLNLDLFSEAEESHNLIKNIVKDFAQCLPTSILDEIKTDFDEHEIGDNNSALCLRSKVSSSFKESVATLSFKTSEMCLGDGESIEMIEKSSCSASELKYLGTNLGNLNEVTINSDNTTNKLLLDLKNSKIAQYVVTSPVEEKIALENDIDYSISRTDQSKVVENVMEHMDLDLQYSKINQYLATSILTEKVAHDSEVDQTISKIDQSKITQSVPTPSLASELQNSKTNQYLSTEDKVSLDKVDNSILTLSLENQLSSEISLTSFTSVPLESPEISRGENSPTDFIDICDYPVVTGLNKSPSKVFNPFPVSLNTRQKKEVPLKLGLYKK